MILDETLLNQYKRESNVSVNEGTCLTITVMKEYKTIVVLKCLKLISAFFRVGRGKVEKDDFFSSHMRLKQFI